MGKSVSALVLTTAFYQERQTEIWHNVMWWQSRLEMLHATEPGRMWISVTLITATTARQHRLHRQTDTWHACVFTRLPVRVHLCLRNLMIPAKNGLSKGLQISEASWEEEGTAIRDFGGWGTGGECQASGNVYPTQRETQYPRWYSLQRHTHNSPSTKDF